MGKKHLLRTVNITDSSDSANDGNVSIMSSVYDSDRDTIEVFGIPYSQIDSDAIGFGGDSYDESNYTNSVNREIGEGVLSSPKGVAANESLNRIYVIDGANIRVFALDTGERQASEEITTNLTAPVDIDIKESTSQLIVSDGDTVKLFDTSDGSLNTTYSDLSFLRSVEGVHYDSSSDLAYVTNNGTLTSIQTINITSGALGTPNGYAGADLTAPVDIWKTSDRIYVADNSQNEIVVFNTSFVNQSSEDISVTSPDSVTIDETLGYGYVISGNTVDCYDLSTQTEITSRSISLSSLNFTSLKDVYFLDGRIYISADGATELLFEALAAQFPTALVHPLAIDRISDSIGTFWESSETDYGFVSGEDYIYFAPVPSPPYSLKRARKLSEIDGNDIDLPTQVSATIKNYTLPTGKRSTNGSITLLASGGTPPYTYQAVGQDGRNEDPQTSPTFSSLNPGNYYFRVTDDNNVNFDLPKFTLSYRTSFSNYGLIYTHQFTDVSGDLNHRIEIFDRDSSTSNTNIDGGSVPVNYAIEAQGEDVYDVTILKATMNISLIASALDTYLDFSKADDERYGIVWSIDDGGSVYNERWRGYLLPETYSQEYGSTPVNVNISFTDRLGDLKNIPYANRDLFNLNVGFTGGEKSQLDVILYCLKQLNMDMDGLRIACDWFESNHDSTSTDTPFEQTYVDTDSYIDIGVEKEGKKRYDFFTGARQGFSESIEFKSVKDCEEVIKSILEPYSATLLTWKGYYWIIKQKDWLDHTSFSYVEYDMDGAQQDTGTETNYVDFGTSEGSNRWRWRGGKQGLVTTRIYRDVKLKLNAYINKEGLSKDFVRKNVNTLGATQFSTFQGYQLIRNNEIDNYLANGDGSKIAIANTFRDVPDNTLVRWVIEMLDYNNGNTHIRTSRQVTYSGSDKLNFNIKIKTAPSVLNQTFDVGFEGDDFPYLNFKWRLKLGAYWYNHTSKTWSTNTQINYHFIDSGNFNKELDLSFLVNLRDVSKRTETLRLDVYAPTASEYDHTGTSTEALLLDDLQAVDTVDLVQGVRQVARLQVATNAQFITYDYYFYELQNGIDSGTEPDVVEPDDYNATTNDKRWRLITKKTLIFPQTRTEFIDINPQFLPNGIDIREDFELSKMGNSNNKVTLERSLDHFDTPPGINNGKVLYYNILRYDTEPAQNYIDTAPTTSWDDGGSSRRIQDHRLNWLIRLSKEGRQRISGAVDYNTEISPLQVLRDPDRDNRKYFINGGTWDLKNNQITGEFLEIGNDVAPGSSSIDSSADSSAGE